MDKDAVDKFISQLQQPWQQKACREVLDTMLSVEPNFEMSLKWGNPFFALDGSAVIKWFVAKEWINIYFYKGKDIADPDGLFIETDNATMRTVQIFDQTPIQPEAFESLIKQAVQLRSR